MTGRVLDWGSRIRAVAGFSLAAGDVEFAQECPSWSGGAEATDDGVLLLLLRRDDDPAAYEQVGYHPFRMGMLAPLQRRRRGPRRSFADGRHCHHQRPLNQ